MKFLLDKLERGKEPCVMKKQHVFIVGSKGIPAAYGGYETFVDKLTQYRTSDQIQYYVACAVDEKTKNFTYHNAHCFNIVWKKIGAAKAILYDCDALEYCIRYIEEKKIEKPVVYVLACRIGPFFQRYVKRIHKLGGQVYVNPDGHEWMRAKWSMPIRKYWKLSEGLMVKYADLLICDSKNIEKYIQTSYAKYYPNTTFIAYGADTVPSKLSDEDENYTAWLKEKDLKPKEYYLVVGRFVPENNFETMIREFMKSNSQKNFAIITTANDEFLEELEQKLHFKADPRIKFVGTVYDQELLKKIRENAYGYFHGHEVGGTNPSLLEALGSTDLNLLLDVGFNREVAENGAIYWNKEDGNLAGLIERADEMNPEEIAELGEKAKQRIRDWYSWEYIVGEYERVFLAEVK